MAKLIFHYRMIQCREMFHFFNDLSTVFKYIRQRKLKIIILLKNYIFSWKKKHLERKVFSGYQ